MSGCAVCVYDLYQESQNAYREAVGYLRTSLSAMHIPESEWPDSIRENARRTVMPPQQNVSLNAFEEMERRLKQKHKREPLADSVVTS